MILRGNVRQPIFFDEQDRECLLVSDTFFRNASYFASFSMIIRAVCSIASV